MSMIADILLIAGALGAGLYCVILSRKLDRFSDLENGVGGAIASLSGQVDQMTQTLSEAQLLSRGSTASLLELTSRAERVAGRLELMVASMHDIPDAREEPSVQTRRRGEDGASNDLIFRSRRRAGEVRE